MTREKSRHAGREIGLQEETALRHFFVPFVGLAVFQGGGEQGERMVKLRRDKVGCCGVTASPPLSAELRRWLPLPPGAARPEPARAVSPARPIAVAGWLLRRPPATTFETARS